MGEGAEQLLAILARGVRRQVLDLDAELLLGLGEAGVGRIVEALVASAADVVDQTDPQIGLGGVALVGRAVVTAPGVGLVVITARCREQGESEKHGDEPQPTSIEHAFLLWGASLPDRPIAARYPVSSALVTAVGLNV
jgi:hypothetical protein